MAITVVGTMATPRVPHAHSTLTHKLTEVSRKLKRLKTDTLEVMLALRSDGKSHSKCIGEWSRLIAPSTTKDIYDILSNM